jgi:hypothetical protein
MLLTEEDGMDAEELESQLALLRSYGAEDGQD